MEPPTLLSHSLDKVKSVIRAVKMAKSYPESFRMSSSIENHVPATPLLSEAQCATLMRHLDQNHTKEEDLKLDLSAHALSTMVGPDTLAGLARIFGGKHGVEFNQIKLRRVEARGQCINFHLDHSKRTMQVPLNGDDEYVGGRLVFATETGLLFPRRSAGSATIHDYRIVHGVTTMKQGTRYSLFFLRV